ncbi:MAG: hypothetical protein OEO79_09155 [Gemmatimonadota bacterium]|nr:hypothetical protein [Gemmatimonadota bacterium]
MSGRPLFVMFAATVAGLATEPASAQTEVTIELGASQIGPAAGLDEESSRFGMAGLRVSHYGLGGSGITTSLMFGQAFGEPNGGDFVSGVVGATLRDRWGSAWIGGLDLQLVGFQVNSPYPYVAFALEGGPSISVQGGPVSVTAAAIGGVGRSQVEIWRFRTGATLLFEDELWRVGGTGEITLGTGPVRAGVTGGLHESAGGSYTSGGALVTFSGRWGIAEVRTDVWDTPLGSEVTGGLTFAIPMSGWSLRGFLGKSEPDPLTLAEPGSGGGGILLGRRIYSSDDERAGGADGPYEIVSRGAGQARVRISMEAPASARSVALLGDFTLWDSMQMRRTGGRWVAELDVPEGTHHYGFLVDDEWYLPDDARDVVPDEWGRRSAILVIEGVS